MTPDDIARTLDDKDEFEQECLTCSAPTFAKVRGPEFHNAHEAAWNAAYERFLATKDSVDLANENNYLYQLFGQELTKFGYKKLQDWSGYYWEKGVTEGLDDVDEFVTKGSYCEHCNELVEEVVPVDPYEPQYSLKVCRPCLEIIQQGPQDDRWLKFFESLDDSDEFHTPDRCQRCGGRDYVEPVYFSGTSENLCRWCAKELFIDISYHIGESIEDADEFGNIRATAGYEEAGVDTSKHVFVFEDGARLYQDAKVSDVGVMYRVVLKTPDGQTHRSAMNFGEEVPMPFNQYWDGMYDFIREGEILPFTPKLFYEFQQVMTVTESIDDQDEFGGEPPFVHITITDPKLSAKEAIDRTIDMLKNPRNYSPTDRNGWNVTGIDVTAYSPNDFFVDDANYERLVNIPGALSLVEGFIQHQDPLLAAPELAFTDSFYGPGINVQVYVGY